MAVRRSTRLQNQEAQGPAEVQQSATVEVVRNKKRKAPAANTDGTTQSKKKAAKSAIRKGKEPPVPTQIDSTNDVLSSLPPEILHMILNNIKDPSTLGKLCRTCKSYYSIMMPRLHNRIAVAAMFHAHIPKLIRALEPHLTIAQKRQLKKEGKYKGQQERYSSHLDEHSKPICASYVRQIVVGVANPGRKHEDIVRRYIEEAFSNMDNLEIVETQVLTKSMGQSLASLKNLQALRLFASDFAGGAMIPLAKIKNLKHLSVDNCAFSGNAVTEDVVQSILVNSMSTLRSLALTTTIYASNFLHDWEKKLATANITTSQTHDFTALKSLALSGVSFDAAFIKSLQRAIDFIGLRHLKLGYLADGKCLLFQHLTNLASSSETTGANINLRSLCLDISSHHIGRTPEQKQADLEAQCRFISSFSTLTSLQLEDYNQYSSDIAANPGLPDMLVQAILKHENLRSLKISYNGIVCGRKIPYLSPTTVATLVNNLPQLEEFEFAPEEAKIDQIGQALSHGTNLTSITCFPHDSWASHPMPTEPGFNILSGIINGVLSRGNGSDSGKFVWENQSKLKRVSVIYRAWDVASKFGKPEKGMKKSEKMKSDGDGKREVLYRDISGTFPQRIHVGYDPECQWVERVAKDID